MFAVIYKGSVYPQHEKEYQHAWRKIAEYFTSHCGALGSCLHKTDQGEWLAYSRWPDQETRDACWLEGKALPAEIKTAIQTLKNCIDFDKPYEEIEMRVVEDFF